MHLRSLLALSPIVAGSMPTLGRRAQCAAVKDRRRGLFVPALTEAQQCSEVVDHRLKDPGGYPLPCLLVDGLPRRKIVGQHPPRSSRTHNPPQGVENLSKVVGTLGRILTH